MIDFELTDEQRLIRETARDFADKEIFPRVKENDRNEHFDLELVKKMADMGFLGAIVPEEYGGRGVDYRTYGLIVEEIGRAIGDVDRDMGMGRICGWWGHSRGIVDRIDRDGEHLWSRGIHSPIGCTAIVTQRQGNRRTAVSIRGRGKHQHTTGRNRWPRAE